MENNAKNEQNRKHRTVILVLAVLLALSLVALGGTYVYRQFFDDREQVSVVVPDNIITPDEETSDNKADTLPSDTTNSNESDASGDVNENTSIPDTSTSNTESSQSTSAPSQEEIIATALQLHNKNPEDNTPFNVDNMFPGDNETKYYCVQVSHKNTVTVRFKADIEQGYEKLAEVLKTRVILKNTDEVLYDGLMKDMPESINYTLVTDKSTTGELYYEITAYLETSVGNEYMEKELKADFKWWVEETENLDNPQTGDTSNITLWLWLMSGSFFLLLLLLKKRKKEEEAYAEQ